MDQTSSTLPVRVLTKQALIAEPIHDLPGADRGGTMRVAYKGLVAGTFRSTLIVMPTGQTSPPRDSDIEHIIVVLSGSFEFIVDEQRYLVHEMDQIFVPVGVRWEYRNAALQQSSFLSIVGP
jgi:quercetin dioxygenase-like cupin family protein